MADMARLETALRNAVAAGDKAAATKIAKAIRAEQPTADAPWYEDAIGYINRGAQSVASGATGGFMDEIAAGLDSPFVAGYRSLVEDQPFDIGQAYDDRLGTYRGEQDLFQEEYPVSAMVTEVGGAVVSPLTKALAPVRGTTATARAYSAAKGGGKLGAVYGAGHARGGLQERLQGAGEGAVLGAALGGVAAPIAERLGSGVSSYLSNRASRAAVQESAPTLEEISRAATRGFKSAEQSGAVVRPEVYGGFVDDLLSTVQREGADELLHPKVFSVLNAIAKRGGRELSISDLKIVRRQIGIAAKGVTPELADERRIAMIMRDKLDDFVEGFEGSDALKAARKAWGVMRRTETVENIIAAAREQASGFENGLRIGFRALLKNKKMLRGFNDAEIEAMQKIVRGTVSANVLKRIGKLSPGTGQQTNMLAALVGGGGGASIGSMLGGPAGAGIGGIAVPLIGYGAQRGGQRLTNRAANYARDLVSRGGQAPVVPNVLSSPQARRSLQEMLLRGGAVPMGRFVGGS